MRPVLFAVETRTVSPLRTTMDWIDHTLSGYSPDLNELTAWGHMTKYCRILLACECLAGRKLVVGRLT